MEIIIILVLLYIAAQTTYLTAAHYSRHKHSRKQQSPIFVDTSVLIDGRIIAVAESGFITSTLFIPRSVLGELQYLADNGDSDKRSRARHGLDIVSQLQAIDHVTVEILQDSTQVEEGVDNRLLKLAKAYKGVLCTIDYNLNKVARAEGIVVLNVNDLAKTLRMAYLPGEKINLELTQKGNDSHQAIGHLVDGTMVVVEHASSQVGHTVEVEFIRSLQTAAGKMMFARLVTPAVKTQPKAIVKQPKGRQPQSPTQVPQPSAKPVQPTVKQAEPKQRPSQPHPNKSRSRRPKTNEDRLVELANQ